MRSLEEGWGSGWARRRPTDGREEKARLEHARRQQLLDLADAPAWPFDYRAYDWLEAVPGIRFHVVKEEPERGVRKCLAWGTPGAQHPRHRHLGDELILVLSGSLADDRRHYAAGEICRSRTGSVHSERILPGEDCICFVVYYGALEMLD